MAAQYADDALREFFERVKEEPWYSNTLFVITADHTSLSDHPLYANLAGHAAAPIFFFDPQGKLQGEISDYVVQHIDPVSYTHLDYTTGKELHLSS